MSIIENQVVTSSDLSRHSSAVFDAADKGRVEISRRDGENLILLRKSEIDRDARALGLAADLIAASLGPEDVPFVDRLQDRFAWLHFLTPREREQFATEIVACARACAATRDFTPFLVDLHEWSSTAAAKATGLTADQDLEWLDTDEAVERPTA